MRIKCRIHLSVQKNRWRMVITSLVAKGKNKILCDDAALIKDMILCEEGLTTKIDNNGCIAIADGVGGNAGGHDASQFLLSFIKDKWTPKLSELETLEMLKDANLELIHYSDGITAKSNMATTFTGLFYKNGIPLLAHVGNTRLYALQGNYLKQMTLDHTTYQWHIMQGNYDETDKCNKSEIISCFGGASEELLKMLYVENVFAEYVPEVLVLTSDGIHDYVDIDTMESIICIDRPMTKRVQKLWMKAVENGSLDDCSIIIVEK